MSTQHMPLVRPARLRAIENVRQPGISPILDKSIAVGLLALLVLTVVVHGAVEPWSVALLQLLLLVLLLIWGVKIAADRRLDITIPGAAFPLAGLLMLGLAQSVAFTGDSGRRVSLSMDVEATRHAVTMLFFLAVAFVMARNFFIDRERLFLLANVLTVSGAAVAAFALIQDFTWEGRLYWLRSTNQNVFGPFVNHNHFAGYMAMLMPAPLALIVTVVRGPARLVYGFAAALMGAAAVVSNSRSGVISLAAAVTFIAILANRRSRRNPGMLAEALEGPRFGLSKIGPVAVVTMAMTAFVFWIGAARIIERFGLAVDQFARFGTPDVSRAAIWRDTLEIIHDHPILGAGFGTFETIYPIYADNERLFALDYAHNDYLQIIAEAGIAGAFLAVLFVVLILSSALRGIRSRDPLLAGLSLAAGGGGVAALVQSLSETVMQIPSNALLLLLLCAVATRCGDAEPMTSAHRGYTKRSTEMWKVRVLSAFLLIVSAALTAYSQDGAIPRSDSASRNILVSPGEEYRIEPRDVVQVYVLQAPELSREYRVSAAGLIEVPFIGKIEAQRNTADELAKAIADGLRGDYLVDPQVSVIVTQISRQFFIQGAVKSPGVYYIEGRPSLLELITIAGGLDQKHGATAFIIRSRGIHDADASLLSLPDAALNPDANPEAVPEYELRKASINAILRGVFSENVLIEPGDIVNIPPADVFFVAGEVKSPGSFPLSEGTTLRQAISLAQGTTTIASPGRAVIFREEGGQKREIFVDVGAVMRGQDADVAIIANDIVVVPNSKTKSVLMPIVHAFGSVAAYTASRVVP